MGLTNIKLEISNPINKRVRKEVELLVDSGAFYSFVNSLVLKELGIKPEDTKEFVLTNGDFVLAN